ncbi:MAG: hypothetical protein AAB446_00175 [Patescibacteria group bacterium]
MKSKILICLVIFFGFFFFAKSSLAVVIFEDSFDSQVNWTRTQSQSQAYSCYAGNCSLPTGWSAIYDGFTYLANSFNNLYLNTNAGFPRTTTDISCNGGSGKCLTFFDESNIQCSHDCSDGNLGVDLGQSYNELYVRFHVAFEQNYQWQDTNPGEKFYHLQYWDGPTDSPWHYHTWNSSNTKPFGIGGLLYYGGHLYYYVGYACEMNIGCYGNPSRTSDVPGDENNMDYIDLGSVQNLRLPGNLFDGGWHSWEINYSLNSSIGTSDGKHRFWLDGNLIYDSNTHNGGIPFGDVGAQASPRKGFRFFALGGNNNNLWNASCTGTDCEQWRAFDDVVISTTYVGPDYTIGGGTPPPVDTTAPSAPTGVAVQ